MTGAEAVAPVGLWPAVARLLRLQLQIFVSGLRRSGLRGKLGAAAIAVLMLSVAGFILAMSVGLLHLLQSPGLHAAFPEIGSLIARVPGLVIALSFVAILGTSFGVSLQALYLADDMDFLLSAPIPIRAVFVAKLLQAILPNLALVALGALPLLVGLGVSSGYSLLYYPLAALMLVSAALAAGGLGSLLVMAVVRVFPARRVAEVLGATVAVVSVVCSQSGQFARPGTIGQRQVSAALRLLASLDIPWSPLAWPGRALTGVGEGRWLAGAGFGLLALGAAGLAFWVALTSAERLYYSGWARMQSSPRRRSVARAPRVSARAAAVPAARFLPPAVAAIVAKDWAVLRRDLRNLSQLITPLILGIVYAAMLLRTGGFSGGEGGDAPAWLLQGLRGAMGYANVGIALFVGWTMLQRLAALGFSHEGRNYWLVKSAPVSAGQLLAAKFLAAYFPSLAISWGFMGMLALVQRNWSTAWFSLPVVAFCLAGADGVSLAFGVAGARMDWEDPRQMLSFASGCLSALVSGAVLGVGMGLFALPQVVLGLLGLPLVVGQLVGLAVGGAFCVACAIVPLWLVRGRVTRLGES
jgi:ABC-2 type transport system permease protein